MQVKRNEWQPWKISFENCLQILDNRQGFPFEGLKEIILVLWLEIEGVNVQRQNSYKNILYGFFVYIRLPVSLYLFEYSSLIWKNIFLFFLLFKNYVFIYLVLVYHWFFFILFSLLNYLLLSRFFTLIFRLNILFKILHIFLFFCLTWLLRCFLKFYL